MPLIFRQPPPRTVGRPGESAPAFTEIRSLPSRRSVNWPGGAIGNSTRDTRTNIRLPVAAVTFTWRSPPWSSGVSSQHAGSKLQPFGFTYSDRVGLLDAGEKLGISRFRANMILAMLENQRSIPAPIAHRKPHKTIPTVLVIVAMELLVISGIVWLSV